MHILCTICSDLVNQAENINVTKCGHIFHYHCLSQWIARSKTCPQCRNKVTEKCMSRIFPTISNENHTTDAATLQSKLDDTQLQLRQEKAECKAKEDQLRKLNDDLKKNSNKIESLEQKLVTQISAVTALKDQILYLKTENKQVNKLREENECLKKNLQMLNELQKVLNATSSEVENMLQGYTDVRTTATFATALKRALCESETKKNELRDKLHAAKNQLGTEKHNVQELMLKISHLEEKLSNKKRKYESLKKRKASEMDQPEINEQRKQARRSNSVDLSTSDCIDLNTAVLTDANNSLNTMVKRIENADSPYLNLKQSSLTLTVLNRAPLNIPAERIKPTDFAAINGKNVFKTNISIFHKKTSASVDIKQEHNTAQLDISYDGLGGHSRLEIFPTPNKKPSFKNLVPKVTAKHKLKRPTPSGSQDIGKLFEKMQDK